MGVYIEKELVLLGAVISCALHPCYRVMRRLIVYTMYWCHYPFTQYSNYLRYTVCLHEYFYFMCLQPKTQHTNEKLPPHTQVMERGVLLTPTLSSLNNYIVDNICSKSRDFENDITFYYYLSIV